MQSPFKRVVVLFNPASTHAETAKKRIREIRRYVSEDNFLLLETSDQGRDANKQLLFQHADMLGAETLLCVVAGDGTINMVVEALTCCADKEAQQTILLPLWGGNANDVAHMLNGPAYRLSTYDLLRQGRVVTVRLLECQLTDAEGQNVLRLAVGYISFGATALAARRLNEPPHRSSKLHKLPGGRLIQELLTVFSALIHAPAFKIEEAGKERLIYDRMFINGSRIGKFRSLPLRLTDEYYYETTASEKRLGAALARFRELVRRPSVKKAPQVTRFTCLDEAWAQFDGETIQISPGTSVTVRYAETSLRAFSVRLGGKGS